MKALIALVICLSFVAAGSVTIPRGCSMFSYILNGFGSIHLPHLNRNISGAISQLIGKRFLIDQPFNFNWTNLFKNSQKMVQDSIKQTLPVSKEITHTCRLSLKTSSQSDLDFIRAMSKIYKICVICDNFDTNTTTCDTIGFCPSTSVCYRGYSDDRKYWPASSIYNIFDAMDPKAVFHGCCDPKDTKCLRNRYAVKNINNKNLVAANYTLRRCSTTACNGDDRSAMTTFIHKIDRVDGNWASWGSWDKCTVTCGSGTRTRHRTCTNPAPKSGGKTCIGSSSSRSSCPNLPPCPVNGKWSTWLAWGSCSVTCGGGKQTRTRSCSDPKPAHGGRDCVGGTSEARDCGQPCIIDGHWSSWGRWGSCQVTCGGGTKSRYRSCTNPAPSNGGKSCAGSSVTTTVCSTSVECPVDGHWALWGHWGHCSVTCGSGTRTRQRSCSNPAPSHGGKACSGGATSTVQCIIHTSCPVDGHWISWGHWNHCPVTCGTGTRTRLRSCTNPAPAHGGKTCTGDSTATKQCVTQTSCPVDGHWATWGHWGHCSVTCGSGTKTRHRTCSNPAPSAGGHNCPGEADSSSTCSDLPPCPVNGKWSSWQAWGTCSVTCGQGTQSRARTCANPKPAHGGHACVGDASDLRDCGHICTVDGHWSSWERWGHCSATCGSGSKTRHRSCTNPAPAHGGKSCSGGSSSTTSCTAPAECPVDGNWSSWESWGHCSATCGSGTKTRHRSCTSPAPAHGGKSCTGVSSSTASCRAPTECPVDGQWSSWESWGHCSATCGSGTKTRHRSCTHPAPAHGGKSCSGVSSSTASCRAPTECPVDGQWSTWGAWGSCSVTCGDGKATRARSCSNPAPAHGGKSCVGDATVSRNCGQPCIIDGGWSNWQHWSKCSKSCSAGTRSRGRTCSNPVPAHGGKDCVGHTSATEACDNGPCPEWTHWFYDACSVTCGSGTTMRMRHCSSGKDSDCGIGKAMETVTCNEGSCPIDGSWGAWKEWSSCTATCGTGQHTRSRSCDDPSPQNGGAVCSGPSKETTACTVKDCPHWLPFEAVSSCSVTCGKGFMQMKRNCSTGIQSDCEGSPFDEKTCILDECL